MKIALWTTHKLAIGVINCASGSTLSLRKAFVESMAFIETSPVSRAILFDRDVPMVRVDWMRNYHRAPKKHAAFI
jgi:hypothetical protein